MFVVAAGAGGYAVAGAGPLMLANASAYAVTTALRIGQSDEQSPGAGQVVAGTRAVEYPAGEISETGFLDAAQKYLGSGYKEVSPGRYVSDDGKGVRQVRFGAHETRGSNLHAHFEAYDVAGGRVIENSVVKIGHDEIVYRIEFMSEYLIHRRIWLKPHHKPTGRTRHTQGAWSGESLVRGAELPVARELMIAQLPPDEGYYLLYLDEKGHRNHRHLPRQS